MRPKRTSLKLAALFIGLTLAQTTPAYGPSMPHSAFVRNTSNTAIVVFTGDDRRIIEGLRLYMDGVADRLLITGMEAAKIDLLDLYQNAGFMPARSLEGVYIDKHAKTTYENAVNTRIWLSGRGIENIILVTSDFHVPRSRLLLEKQLGQNSIRIETFSVPSNATAETWQTEARKYNITRWGIPTNPQRLIELMF
ncbi:MAG: YdcF family protein [Proteobacteria bacterium]|nr:YdcF family protein [Pseudomonadota bacterium]